MRTRDKITQSFIILLSFVFLGMIPMSLHAGEVQVTVLDTNGKAVQDAVIYALPKEGGSTMTSDNKKVAVDQVNKEFVPFVSAIEVGTKVVFPNNDQIRHHVYSFSDAKSFEIPLYAGVPETPVQFDKPGVVKLGCNIHDWMAAYIYVADTPYFAITNLDGTATITGLQDGEYMVHLWHPQQKIQTEPAPLSITIANDSKQDLEFTMKKKRLWKAFRAPHSMPGGYR